MISEGIECSVLVTHLPPGDGWERCTVEGQGGPYFHGVPAQKVEAMVREHLGLDFLRAEPSDR